MEDLDGEVTAEAVPCWAVDNQGDVMLITASTMSTRVFGPKTYYSIGPAPARAHCMIQTPIRPKIAYYIKPHGKGKSYIPSDVLESPNQPSYHIQDIYPRISQYPNLVRLETLISNKRELVFNKERQILSLSS